MTNSEQNTSPTSDLINTENQSIQSSQTIKPWKRLRSAKFCKERCYVLWYLFVYIRLYKLCLM